MIKMLFASLLMLASFAASASEVVVNPYEFRKPLPKIMDQYYKEAITQEKAGNPNVKVFMGKVRAGYEKQQKASKRDEPEDVFFGCVLFQIGGPASLDKVNFAHTIDVLAGAKKPDGSEYTEQDAKALVGSMNEEQGIILVQLYQRLQYFAYSCYAYTHNGFIVMPQTTGNLTYALDK